MNPVECGMRSAECGVRTGTLCSVLALFLFAWLIVPAGGQEPENPVELGREAFGKRNYPWYDSSKDEARPLRVGADTETKTDSDTSGSSSSSPSGSAGFGIGLFGSGLQVLGLILLACVLAAAAALIVWAFLKNETQQSAGASVVTASRDVDRVEQLPFALKRTSGDFLAEAQRLADSGNYSEAIIYLYSHLLVQLDKHHVIRLTKGKTNRQYVRETRSRPSLAAILEPTMIAFEDVFFGKHEIDRARFEECHSQIGNFQAELARLERQAA
jgi:hypothetical protein